MPSLTYLTGRTMDLNIITHDYSEDLVPFPEVVDQELSGRFRIGTRETLSMIIVIA